MVLADPNRFFFEYHFWKKKKIKKQPLIEVFLWNACQAVFIMPQLTKFQFLVRFIFIGIG